MFGSVLGDLLPLAIGIAISPVPIIACILILFSARARINGPLFMLGWILGITLVTVIVLVVSDSTDATDATDSGASLGDVVILLLGIGAVALGIRQWRTRPRPGEEARAPAWMAAIADFPPIRAFGFGVLLAALNPKNLGFAIAAGLVIDVAAAAGGNATALVILFVVLASLSIAVPVAYTLVGGAAAQRTLEAWRTWLTAHNAAVMAVLFVVIGVKLLGEGLDALL
jgi:threonine/homoserine/homoserine lactone efflux protein